MRISLFFAALLALTASGCDSVEDDVVSGPVVQFSATSVTASESDGTIEIPVSLTGGNAGETYTVEVLLADAASREASAAADAPEARRDSSDFAFIYGEDVTGFGEAQGANRVATVTLTGPEDTGVVTIEVLEDAFPEAAETVVFALQNASGGSVRVGDARQFRLQIGTPPISAARARPLGTVVTVEGIVTRARGRVSFVQDNSGAAIAVFANGNDYFTAVGNGAIAQGDRIQIVGELTEFNGLLQVGNVSAFSVLSRGNDLPDAQTVTLAQIATSGDTYESELIRVTGLTLGTSNVLFAANTNYDVASGGSTIIMRPSSDSEIDGEAIQPLTGGAPGAYGPFTFTGILGQFRDTNQFNPLTKADFSR